LRVIDRFKARIQNFDGLVVFRVRGDTRHCPRHDSDGGHNRFRFVVNEFCAGLCDFAERLLNLISYQRFGKVRARLADLVAQLRHFVAHDSHAVKRKTAQSQE